MFYQQAKLLFVFETATGVCGGVVLICLSLLPGRGSMVAMADDFAFHKTDQQYRDEFAEMQRQGAGFENASQVQRQNKSDKLPYSGVLKKPQGSCR